MWFNLDAVASDSWAQNNVLACSVSNSGNGSGGPGRQGPRGVRLATHGWRTADSLGFRISVGVYCVQYSRSACLISMLVGRLFGVLGLGRSRFGSVGISDLPGGGVGAFSLRSLYKTL